MSREQRRSSISEMKDRSTGSEGVGARHKDHHHPTRGARYQDVYIENRAEGSKNRARDPRIDELASSGLSWKWISIAEAIGYDDFLMMWQLVSILFADADSSKTSTIRIWMPTYEKMKRLQRDKLIKELAETMDCDGINKELKALGFDTLSHRQLYRITSDSNL